jgi:hypothetical protein
MEDVLMTSVPHVSKRVGDITCAWYGQLVEIFLNVRLVCTACLILFELSDQKFRDGRGMWYITGKRINAANSVGVGKPQVKR